MTGNIVPAKSGIWYGRELRRELRLKAEERMDVVGLLGVAVLLLCIKPSSRSAILDCVIVLAKLLHPIVDGFGGSSGMRIKARYSHSDGKIKSSLDADCGFVGGEVPMAAYCGDAAVQRSMGQISALFAVQE